MKKEQTFDVLLDAVLIEIRNHSYINSEIFHNKIVSSARQEKINYNGVMQKLMDDKNIVFDTSPKNGYYITVTGKMFLEQGGYSARRKSLEISKRSLRWSIIAGIASVIAVVIAVVTLIKQFNP
jgi:hypothetical protein